MIKNILKKVIPWMERDKKIYKLYVKSRKWAMRNKKQIASYYSYKIYKRYGCEISPNAEIGKNLVLPHPVGVVIGDGVRIGDNCVIYQNVTLGRKNRDIAEYPTVGDNVTIYCNSILIGNINIGNNSIVGCNSVVMKSIKENSKCVGVVK